MSVNDAPTATLLAGAFTVIVRNTRVPVLAVALRESLTITMVDPVTVDIRVAVLAAAGVIIMPVLEDDHV